MAWYSGAIKLELQPESDNQPAINPTQFICHSIAAPWDEHRIGQYWDEPGVNVESHFGLDYDGSLGQFLGTETRADANAQANRRSDGTGAVSLESASNTQHTDPWTNDQVRVIIEIGVWLHQRHGIPLRICRTWDDPGYGYHRLFPQWSLGGTACPGDARVKQFRDTVFPGIVRAAQGGTTPPVVPPERKRKMALVSKTMPNVVGDDSTTVFTAVGGHAWINVSADYVPPGEKVTVRIDVSDGAGKWIMVNEIRYLGNGELGFVDLLASERTRIVSVKRLTHPGAKLDATLHYPEA